MAFWSDTGLDPKRQFKFSVTFTGGLNGGGDGKFLAQSADRPVWTVSGETKVDFLDKSFNFPGKIKWNDVKIKFVDAAGAGVNVSQASYRYLSNAGWIAPGSPVPTKESGLAYQTIGKGTAVTSAGTVTVNVLDSTGAIIDLWTLKNAFITTVAFNNLDYAAEGILTAEYTFKYDWAEYSG